MEVHSGGSKAISNAEIISPNTHNDGKKLDSSETAEKAIKPITMVRVRHGGKIKPLIDYSLKFFRVSDAYNTQTTNSYANR